MSSHVIDGVEYVRWDSLPQDVQQRLNSLNQQPVAHPKNCPCSSCYADAVLCIEPAAQEQPEQDDYMGPAAQDTDVVEEMLKAYDSIRFSQCDPLKGMTAARAVAIRGMVPAPAEQGFTLEEIKEAARKVYNRSYRQWGPDDYAFALSEELAPKLKTPAERVREIIDKHAGTERASYWAAAEIVVALEKEGE